MAIFNGTPGNDVETGNPNEANTFVGFGEGTDSLTGGNLNDVFQMKVADTFRTDFINGGGGEDLLDFSTLAPLPDGTHGVFVNMGAGKVFEAHIDPGFSF